MGVLSTDSTSSFDEFLVLNCNNLGTEHTGEGWNRGNTKSDHKTANGCTESCNECNSKEQLWDSHKYVENTHDDHVNLAAEVTSGGTKDKTKNHSEHSCEEAYEEGDSGTMNDTSEHITAEFVCAEDVFRRWAFETNLNVLENSFVFVVADEVCADSNENKGYNDDTTDNSHAVLHETLKNVAPHAALFISFLSFH